MVGGPIWMLKKFFGLIWFVSLLIQVGLVVAYFYYYHHETEPDFAEVPTRVIDVVDAAVKKVPPVLPKSQVELRPTLVVPLKNDRKELITNALREALSEDSKYVSVKVEKGLWISSWRRFGPAARKTRPTLQQPFNSAAMRTPRLL